MIRILIVDDSVFERALLRSILERNGYNVIGEASNGYEAIEKYKEMLPDLVIMDILMPVMDGLSALEEIKTNYPDSKIIMMSSIGQDNYIKESQSMNAVGYILKPLDERKIIELLAKV